MNFQQSSILSILGSFGLIFVNMFINVIQSRILGPEEIGRFQVFITTQTFFANICALGIGQACIYFINALKEDESKVLATAVNATLPVATLCSVVLFFIIIFYPGYFGKESYMSVALFCIGTDAMLISNIFTPVLLTKMEVVRNQIVKWSTQVFTLVALLLLLLFHMELTVGFLVGLTGITSMVGCLILYSYFYKRFSFSDGIDFELLWRLIKWGLKLAGNNVASLTLTSIPVYFLTWFCVSDGFLNVGYYSRANSLLVIGTVLASSIGPLLYSKWSTVKGEELKAQVRKVSMLFILINMVIALGLIVFAPLLVHILYGEEFKSAIPILQILALSLVANGAKEVCYGILSSQGAPLMIMKNLSICIFLSSLINYFTIPIYGILGCAITTVLIVFISVFLLIKDVNKVSIIRFRDFFILPRKADLMNILYSLKNKK